jgi:predicted esterase
MTKFKKAIMLTGAAARISQEVALFDKLQERSANPLQIDEQDTFLAGFSSGSLNLAALNACFRKDAPLGWKSYYQETILFKVF